MPDWIDDVARECAEEWRPSAPAVEWLALTDLIAAKLRARLRPEGGVPGSLPLQPVDDGRFVANEIVQRLLDDGPFDMNDIAMWGVPREHQEQFASLIGYSLGGFADLGYVSDSAYNIASSDGHPAAAESKYLRGLLVSLASALHGPAAELFSVHPDDLAERCAYLVPPQPEPGCEVEGVAE